MLCFCDLCLHNYQKSLWSSEWLRCHPQSSTYHATCTSPQELTQLNLEFFAKCPCTYLFTFTCINFVSGFWLIDFHMGRAKRIWYLSPMRAAKVQASLRIRAVSPEPSLLAHTSSESRGTFRQKARSLAPLNGWACAVKVCHDGMLEDTNSLGAAHIKVLQVLKSLT